MTEPVRLEPYPDAGPADDGTNPEARYQERGSAELAFYARGGDATWAMWQWLDRAPLGRNEGDMSWFHRYDEYPA